MLDVGTGVGEIAVALAEAVPSLHVVGLDILDDVLAAARIRVVERGLADRIMLRRQDVATLTDIEAFDLAHLPAYFVPEDAVLAALPRIRTALRPGGWIFIPVREDPGASWRARSPAGSTRDARYGVPQRPSAGWSSQGSATSTASWSAHWRRPSWWVRVAPSREAKVWATVVLSMGCAQSPSRPLPEVDGVCRGQRGSNSASLRTSPSGRPSGPAPASRPPTWARAPTSCTGSPARQPCRCSRHPHVGCCLVSRQTPALIHEPLSRGELQPRVVTHVALLHGHVDVLRHPILGGLVRALRVALGVPGAH
jgi:hypothetical protein